MAGDAERHALAQELYDLILMGANKFLHNCGSLSITTLQQVNEPTFEELAHNLELISKFVVLICVDPMMGVKAAEYCGLMLKMAVAIRTGNETELAALVVEMKQKPGV